MASTHNEKLQTFEIVYTELDGKIPTVIGVTAESREAAERIFSKANLDKNIVKDPRKHIYISKAIWL